MKFDGATSDALTKYLHQALSKTSTRAAADLLATYIVAILTNDKSMAELREKCVGELEEFMGEETGPFVSSLFTLLEDHQQPTFLARLKELTGDSEPEKPQPPAPRAERRRSPPRHQNYDRDSSYSRKRQRSPLVRESSRSPKRERRQSPSEGIEIMEGAGPLSSYEYDPQNSQIMSNDNRHENENRWGGSSEGRNERDRGERRNRSGREHRDRDRGDRPDRNRERDRDRHGNPPPAPFPGYGFKGPYMMSPVGGMPMMGPMGMPVPYLPSSFQMGMGHNGRSNTMDEVAVDLLQRQAIKDKGQDAVDDDQNRDNRRGRRNFRNEERELANNQKGNNTLQNTTLVVTSIPHNLNTIGKLDEHFGKFGSIVNIEVLQRDKRAKIKFSSHNDALKAWKSPDAILGNRFIKVFWDDPNNPPKIDEIGSSSAPPPVPEQPKPSPEEIKKVIEENKKKAVLAAQQALEMKAELQQKKLAHIKEKNALLNKLIEQSKKPNLTKEKKATLLAQIKTLSDLVKRDLESLKEKTPIIPPKPAPKPAAKHYGSTSPAEDAETSEESSHKSALAGKLEVLKKEARELGIPLGQDADVGVRGRGRGSLRARGTRGRGRGARGGFAATRITLDNRTTSFMLSNLPDGILNENVLKEHFSDFGEVVSVSIEGQNAIVKMSKRQEAEFAVHKGSVINEHRATVKWYIEPAQETGYGESEEEGEDAGEGENEEAEAEADAEEPVVEVEEEWYQGDKDDHDEDQVWRK